MTEAAKYECAIDEPLKKDQQSSIPALCQLFVSRQKGGYYLKTRWWQVVQSLGHDGCGGNYSDQSTPAPHSAPWCAGRPLKAPVNKCCTVQYDYHTASWRILVCRLSLVSPFCNHTSVGTFWLAQVLCENKKRKRKDPVLQVFSSSVSQNDNTSNQVFAAMSSSFQMCKIQGITSIRRLQTEAAFWRAVVWKQSLLTPGSLVVKMKT